MHSRGKSHCFGRGKHCGRTGCVVARAVDLPHQAKADMKSHSAWRISATPWPENATKAGPRTIRSRKGR